MSNIKGVEKLINALILFSAPILLVLTAKIDIVQVIPFNYDMLFLTNGRLLVLITLSIVFPIWIIVSRKASRDLLKYLLLLSILFASIFAANFPNLVHRDAYLHGGPVQYIITTGHINGLENFNREDVLYWPMWFILSSMYVLIAGCPTLVSLTLLTLLFGPILIVFIYSLIIKKVNAKLRTYMLLALPYLINRYGLITGLFGRFSLGILYLIMIESVFIKFFLEKRFQISTFVIAIILSAVLVLTHPYISSFLVLSVVTSSLVSIVILAHKEKNGSSFRYFTMLTVSIVTIFIVHFTYYSVKYSYLGIHNLLNYLYNPSTLVEFGETSAPITVEEYPPGARLLFQAFRYAYRAFLLISVIALGFDFIYKVFKVQRGRIDNVSLLAISKTASLILLSIYLISSSLWWERTVHLSFFVVLWFLFKTLESYRTPIINALLITATVLAVVLIPILPFDMNFSTTRIVYKSVDETLITIVRAASSSLYKLCGGTYTSIYYSYYAILYRTATMAQYKPSLTTRDTIVAFSLIDPEIIRGVISVDEYDHLYSNIFDSNMTKIWMT